MAALPSISFITGQHTIKHLGVLMGYDMQAASNQQFITIYHAISAKVRYWAARGLSFLGRVHVAKQVLAASLWYHASFQRPSELLKQLSQQLRFMDGDHPSLSRCVVSFSLMVCGHHISLRLLSYFRVMYISPPNKKKKKQAKKSSANSYASFFWLQGNCSPSVR